MAVGDAYMFPGFPTPVLTQLFFPKPPTTFPTCFCRGERRKYAGKKSRLDRGSNSQPPGHESDTLTTEPPGRGSHDYGSIEFSLSNKTVSVPLTNTKDLPTAKDLDSYQPARTDRLKWVEAFFSFAEALSALFTKHALYTYSFYSGGFELTLHVRNMNGINDGFHLIEIAFLDRNVVVATVSVSSVYICFIHGPLKPH